MPIAELHPAFKSLKGKIGDLTVVRHSEGKVILRRTPVFKDTRSEAQLAHREKVTQAAHYGKRVLADPELARPYRDKGRELKRRAFNLAFRDFFRPPEVTELDLSHYTGRKGETIEVVATDDFEVTAVDVQLQEVGGAVLEEGAAVLSEAGRWVYTSRTTIAADTKVVVVATAHDRAANTGSRSQHWITGKAAE